MPPETDPTSTAQGIAIVGLAGRFPGAEDVSAFWNNLIEARETITTLKRAELAPGEPATDPDYVLRRGLLDQAEWFDAAFFGMGRVEAEVTDPQQRVFLEVAWTALEHAGYDPHRLPGVCGVWAGTGNNHYFQKQLAANAALLDAAGAEAVMIGNEKDYVATRVAYRLNLRGPAINVVTACSTSLVAVAQATHGLLTFQCDLALAGGASIRWPQNRGYLHEEGGIMSPDGHCRAFDEKSAGTVFSSGAGCVVLKRVEDALRDGDTIYAVIRSAALNNDGAGKASFTAPGTEGQAENITMALALADVPPQSIDFVEAHGTGTALGDVIEVAALTKAFRNSGDERVAECGLGSLKTATGHMDAAAGVGGLIKAALALHHGVIPPTLHFQRPNPKLDLEHSPFRVVAETTPLSPERRPHRALVAALGVGGTNAHVVLEEAPLHRPEPSVPPTGGTALLVLSARSEMALAAMQGRLADFLEARPETDLHDAAFTLAKGRMEFTHRASLAVSSVAEAVLSLRGPHPRPSAVRPSAIAFLFSGQGSQHRGMGSELASRLPLVRDELARCASILGFDPLAGTDEELAQTSRTQPALFCLGYALAQQLMAWGVTPSVLLGHSIGEYVAATLAGVFTLDDALRIVVARGRALQAQPPGVMLAVRCAESDLALPPALDLAAVNAPQLCVVAGPDDAITAYESACAARPIGTRRLRTSHAFHSRSMDGALDEFRRAFAGVTLQPPRSRVISNLTGTDLTADQATSPDYWIGHVRATVRFAAGVEAIKGDHLLIEVGPSNVLTQLARQAGATAVATLPAARDGGAGEVASVLDAVGQLWCAGAAIDWDAMFPEAGRRRLALPTYPFERQRFCPEPGIELPPAAPWPALRPDLEAVSPDAPGLEIARPPDAAAPWIGSDRLFPISTPALDGAATPPATGTGAADSPAPSRRETLVRELQHQLLRISGIDVSAQPATTSFFDLGFDSLFLTQAGTALKKHFGVKITFRQLMEELTSIDALATFLDAQLPPTAFASDSGGPTPTPPARRHEAAPLPSGRPADAPVSSAFAVQVREQRGSEGKKISFGPFKPIEKAKDGALTAPQRAHLAKLIADYGAKFPKTKQFTAENRDHFADPRAVSGFNPLWKEMVFPVVTDRSEGAYLWDVDGHRWIDVVHGFGSGFFGHRPAFVVEALKAQLDKGYEIGPTHPLAGEVARMIKEFSGQDRVAFSNTGSESLMAAIRVARTVTGRDRIAMFAGAYHGIFDEVLARPLVINGELRSIPIAPGIPESAQAHLIVLEYGHPESLEIIRRHGSELAAVLVEPVPSRRPDIAPVAFVQELRRITAESGTALIFDEVVLGWRTGPAGAQKIFGIEADLVAYGKVVGGGMPLGVLAGRRRFMDALDGGAWQYGDDSAPEVGVTFFAGTFIRHPLTLAACKAVLDKLKADGPALQREVDDKTARFVSRLSALFDGAGVPIKVSRFSSLWMLNADPGLKYFGLLFYHLRLRGIHIWEGRGNFLSTAHTEAHADAILAAFADSVRALQDGEFFPEARGPALGGAGGTVGDGALPLTPEQEELFLAAKMSIAASVAAHESVTLRLRGPLDGTRLKSALARLAERHDSLRTAFAPDGSRQVVEERAIPELRIIDGTDLEAASAAEFLQPFNLEQAPLWRVALASHNAGEHSLLITAHHLICDGWSFGVIAHDLACLYRGETLPPATPLRAVVEAERDPEAARYWQTEFTTRPTPLDLPFDRPRPSHPGLDARTLRGGFDDRMAAALREFCRREKATPNAVLLSAWQILLHRLTGESDLIVGTPMAGQLSSGHADLVAHQVHFLPVRIPVPEKATVSEWIAQTKGKLADAADHLDYTLGQLYQAAPHIRQAGRTSFVTNTFTFESAAAPEDWDGLRAHLEPNPKRKLAFDLSLFIIQDGEALRWQLVYQSDLFDEATVAHWMRCLTRLIAGMVDDPAQPAGALPLLDAADTALILGDWNDAGLPAPPRATIHRLFEEQVDRIPAAPALIAAGGEVSYAQLDRRANQFAHDLREVGLAPAQTVAVFAERSPQMIAALLGILKAGGSYAPIDAGYPDERIALMLRDLNVPIVVCDPGLCSRLERLLDGRPTRFVPLTPGFPEEGATATDRLEEAAVPDAPAYLIFTSGSTGQPKAAIVPHRAVVRLVREQHFATMTGEPTWLQLAPLSFDASTLEIWAPLLNGGRLALMPPGPPTPREIGDAIRRCGVTSIWLTAGLFQLMVDECLDDLAPLRELLTGGDVVSRPHARRVLERFPHLRLINGYGPTENTTFTCCHTITPEDLARPSLPIGRPIAQTTAFIVDASGEPCPIGVAGELLTGGMGLALGYWHRDDLTAEKFIEHPRFGRVYRTGDRTRWRADGTIEFLGRADTQIKIRGFRIEPGEIEAALLTHPSVRQATVQAPGTSAGDKRLIAWCVPATAAGVDPATLREHLLRQLPDYMVPQDFVAVPGALPLTANGKIDVRALPDPAAAGLRTGPTTTEPEPPVPPRNDVERRMHRLMEESLGRNHFGVRDDFFALGGDSLRGLRLVTRIEKEFGRALPLGSLFSAPTVEKLARLIGDGRGDLPRAIIPIQPNGRQPPLILLHGGDGGVLFYRQAVSQLDPDQPVLAIESPMLTDLTRLSPGSSVEAVAADYLELVRLVQATGPYRLGGYSFGGIVAYELARQLRAAGQSVEHLILFDTDNPAVPPREYSALGRLRARWSIDASHRVGPAQRGINLLYRVTTGWLERRRVQREVSAVEASRRAGCRAPAALRSVELREAHQRLRVTYRPGPSDSRLTLFRCMDPNDKFEHSPALGWESVVGGHVTIFPVTGTHLELFNPPHATLVAEKLAECLAPKSIATMT